MRLCCYGNHKNVYHYLYCKSGFITEQWNFKSSLLLQKNMPVNSWMIHGNNSRLQYSPRFHLTKGLIRHVFAIIAPLPFHALPIVHTANPYITAAMSLLTR